MMYVPSVNDRNQEGWRLLVEERIANLGKQRTFFLRFNVFWLFLFFWFWVFTNQSTVHSGGVSKVRVLLSSHVNRFSVSRMCDFFL